MYICVAWDSFRASRMQKVQGSIKMMQYFKDTDKIDWQLQLVCSRKSTHPSLHSYFIYLDFIEIHRKHKRPKKKNTDAWHKFTGDLGAYDKYSLGPSKSLTRWCTQQAQLQCQHEFEIKFLNEQKYLWVFPLINNSVAYQQ